MLLPLYHFVLSEQEFPCDCMLSFFCCQPVRPRFPVLSHPLLVGSNSTPSLSDGCQLTLLPSADTAAGRPGSAVPLTRMLSTNDQQTSGSVGVEDFMCSSSNELHTIINAYPVGANCMDPCDVGTYAAHQPPPPPLGYIVAYTPEQLTEIIRDQYHSGHQSSLFHQPAQRPIGQTKSSASVSISLVL
jgi:hypothetical protein